MPPPAAYPLRVDPADGALHIGDGGLRVDAGMRDSEAQQQLGDLIDRDWNHNNGYAWMGIGGPLRLEGMPASASLCFFEGRLTMVMLGVALPDDELDCNWPTEPTIHRHVRFLQRALSRQLDCPMETGSARFAWGSAWARFDLKGFMASAGLSYDAQA